MRMALGAPLIFLVLVVFVVSLPNAATLPATTPNAHQAPAAHDTVLASGTIVHRPAKLRGGRRHALVLVFYGGGGSPQGIEATTRFDGLADRYGFIAAYPQSLGNANQIWHPGNGDIPAVSALIDHLVATEKVDPTQIYAMGFSLGGAMTFELACQLGRRFAAVAAVSQILGRADDTGCRRGHPISELLVAGTADPGLQGNTGGISYRQTQAIWRSWDGCRSPGNRSLPAPSWVETRWSGCRGGSEVRLYEVLGGQHTWPGPGYPAGSADAGFDISSVIWKFFSDHLSIHG